MKPKCPYCGAALGDVATIPEMSRRQDRVYCAVIASGRDGIHPEKLLLKMYDKDQAPTPGGSVVLRVIVHEINKKISAIGQRIISRPYKKYRLISTRGERRGKTAKETNDKSGDSGRHTDSGA